MNGNLLGLTSPTTMGQAARKGASLPWIIIVSSDLLKTLPITCEVVEPRTSSFVTFTLVSADWVITADFILPDIALVCAPFDLPLIYSCYWYTTTSFSLVSGFLLKGQLAFSCTISRWTEGGSQGWAASSTTSSKTTGGNLDCVVRVTTVHCHWFVEEGKDVVKELNRGSICVFW